MWKRVGWGLLVGGSVVVAVLVAKRVQPDALAFLLGVGAGFLVSLPMEMLGFLLLARRVSPRREAEQEETASPVVLLAPGAAPQVWRQPEGPSLQGMPDPPRGRHFVISDWD